MFTTDDVRIENLRPLIPPAILMEEIPVSDDMAAQVIKDRQAIAAILHGVDPRWLVVMGPCSIHDPQAGFVYAQRLKELAERYRDVLMVVMRAYFEKPRTTVGWKGLINDPHIDESYAVNQGLRLARGFLRDVTALGRSGPSPGLWSEHHRSLPRMGRNPGPGGPSG
jgi:3-deoxy-7-phosphoheptulonate synthase